MTQEEKREKWRQAYRKNSEKRKKSIREKQLHKTTERIEYMKQYRLKNKGKLSELNKVWVESKRDDHYQRLYGISVDEYNSMFNEQQGRCCICGIHQSELKKRLNIDHDHNTGLVRGLLCWSCNISLGYFKDDITVLENAIWYLTKDNI